MAEQCGCGGCGGAAKPVKKEEKTVRNRPANNFKFPKGPV